MATLTDLQPDLVVVSSDQIGPLLAVEVKLAAWDLDQVENRLGEFMDRVGCPIGLIVTPKRILLYRNTFREPVLKRLGDFLFEPDPAGWLPAAQELNPQARSFYFERAVQDWLESLSQPSVRAALPDSLREAFESYVVPALLQGELRVTGPRKAARSSGS